MSAKIRAGTVEQISKDSGEWLFVDLGFSKSRKSCGIVDQKGDGKEVKFARLAELVTAEAQKRSPKPLNLMLEAPLSVAFADNGNPSGRLFEKQGRKHWYWYENAGAAMVIAAGYLLRKLQDCGIQREVRLFEGFMPGKQATPKDRHVEVAKKLRNAVWNLDASKSPSKKIKALDSGCVKSISNLFGMDFSVPPVILTKPRCESPAIWHYP